MIQIVLILFIAIGAALLFRIKLFSAFGIYFVFVLAGAVLPYLLYQIADFVPDNALLPFHRLPMNRAFALVMLGSGASIFTYLLTLRKSPSEQVEVRTTAGAKLMIRLAAGGIGAGLIYFGILVFLLGSITDALIVAQQRVRVENSLYNATLPFSFAAQIFPVFAWYLFLNNKRRSLGEVVIVAMAVALGLFVAFSSGGRSVMVLFVVALAWGRLIRLGIIGTTMAAIFGAVIIGTISAVFIRLRYDAQGYTAAEGQDLVELATTGLTFIDHTALAIDYAEFNGFTYGQSYLNAFTLIIPRDLWEDKPLQLSVLLREFFYGDTWGGAPPGLFGEAYIAGGTFGVLIAGLVFGRALGRLDMINAKANFGHSPFDNAFAAIMVPLVPYALIRGGIDIGAIRVGIPLAIAFALLWGGRSFYERRVGQSAAAHFSNSKRASA